MSTTSRNTMMVGGALIVVALLLTCGPALRSWFTDEGIGVREAPAVSAGPPVEAPVVAPVTEVEIVDEVVMEEGDALIAAASGSLAGGEIGASESANGLADGSGSEGMAGVALGSASPGSVASSAASTATTAGSAASRAAASTPSSVVNSPPPRVVTPIAPSGELPPVSAGVPEMALAAADVPAALPTGAVAADAFDKAFGESFGGPLSGISPPGGSLDAAGRVVERFAPPVAAVGSSAISVAAAAQPFGAGSGGVRLPCDAPGSACQNVNGLGGGIVPPPNPIIVPGARPPRRNSAAE